jgi:ring-1,2-phenylacetyl-CoA epoxidase subunit PaaE
MSIVFHKLKIADLRRETPDAVSVAFAIPDALRDAYRFSPGQHLTLKFDDAGKELRRSYSICAGMDDGELRIAVKKVDGGSVSSWVNEKLRAGDEIEVMTPQGRFGVPPAPGEERTYLAIAAGSGITPIHSMIRTMLTREPKSRFILIYGNRNARSIMFKDQLEDLKDRFLDRLIIHHVLSREPQEIALLSGRLDREKIASLLKGSVSTGQIAHAFLCGPGGLVKEGEEALRGLGLEPARIHVEYFSVEGIPVAPKVRTAAIAEDVDVNASITLNGIQYDVPMKADETIVDAGLRAGLDMPFSCKGGMCCTCRAKLTAGNVEMEHNYSLEDWEMKAGFVLTCQARPTTGSVAVDFDQL